MTKKKVSNEATPPALHKTAVSGSGIDWKYFFGGGGGRTFDRYYYSEINGKLVEKHASNKGVKYAIGNIDTAKKKYKTEAELISACIGIAGIIGGNCDKCNMPLVECEHIPYL
jgi:hypothetical protein